MVQAHKPALFTGKHEEAKHVGSTDIVTAEFEAGQREVHVRPSLIDQIARLMPAGRHLRDTPLASKSGWHLTT
jgi:hypothetical protein